MSSKPANNPAPVGNRILAQDKNCWKAEPATKVSFLIDADEYFRAFRKATIQARESVYICGWDIDSRLRLLREDPEDGYPVQLREFLDVVAAKNKLRIYILIWDFAMLLAMSREWFPLFKLGWQTHRNIHFAMDGLHPVGGSQHQKLVIIDDSLAFCGGLDLTQNRWDTPEHKPDDRRRRSVDGKSYRPHHDVQIMVDGQTATNLGTFFRDRWEMVTGQRISVPRHDEGADIWPKDVYPDVYNGRVGIARTIAPYKKSSAVREVERLYLDSISRARKYIYIENQYLTAPKISQALAESLRKGNGPEIVIILPKSTDGWLSQYTMDLLRYKALHKIVATDRHGRLGVFYAHYTGLAGPEDIKIHSKLMVIDDFFVRIGSSNMNNRSLGLDTECDLAMETATDTSPRDAAAVFCHKLLAEHLDVEVAVVQETIGKTKSLLKTILKLQGRTRTLKKLEIKLDKTVEVMAEQQDLLDPEKPVEPERFIDQWMSFNSQEESGYNKTSLLLLVVVCLGLALAWRFTPLQEMISGEQLSRMVNYLKNSKIAWLYVTGAYIFGSVLVVPITGLITLTFLVYGSVSGFAYSIVGASISGAITYWLGRFLGRKAVRKLAGNRLNKVSRRLGKNGVISILIARFLPIAPYSIVNMVAGASHISFLHFMLGTILGLLPGVLAIAGLVDRGFAVLKNPGPISLAALLAVAGAVAITFLAIRQKLADKENNADQARNL